MAANAIADATGAVNGKKDSGPPVTRSSVGGKKKK